MMLRFNRQKPKFIRRAALLLTALCIVSLIAGCASEEIPEVHYYSPYDYDFGKTVEAEIVFEDFGAVKLALYPDEAPITVQNFVDLASSGFYDGLTIHRVAAGFVIQGGSPTGTGFSDPDHPQPTIKCEFTANGVENRISHVRGVLSMARIGGQNDSATSQFFIMLSDRTQAGDLNGNYAAFGCVTEGMDVVDRIAAVEVIEGTDSPAQTITIERVKILDY